MYALIDKISKNKATIDQLFERSEILKNEPRLDKYMCYILTTELLFGAKQLNGDSKPVQCVRSYEDKFKAILAEIDGHGGKKTESADGTAETATTSAKGKGWRNLAYLRTHSQCLLL